jgi:glutamate-5-semialdehyde dehydrogenase
MDDTRIVSESALTASLNAPEAVSVESSTPALMADLGRRARQAARRIALASAEEKNAALRTMAAAIRARAGSILAANEGDLTDAKAKGQTPAFIDRLALDPGRLEAVAAAVESIADLPDPVGRVLARFERPNGLLIERVATPLGVIGVIFESRPNVTADAGALCLKAGNAAILRAGSESFRTSQAIARAMGEGLEQAGLPPDAIRLVPTRDRAAVGAMLSGLGGQIDVIVPRGGRNLVARVQEEARVPVFAHLEGICHVFVHRLADLEMAGRIVLNAKMRRTGVCGSAETLLVDRACAATHLGPLVAMLLDAGCAVRGDEAVRACDPRVTAATEEDWRTEYLDAVISARVVDGPRRGHSPYRGLRLPPYGFHRHGRCGGGRAVPGGGGFGHRAPQCLDPVRRRGRVRLRGRDRHRHGPDACPRARGRGAADLVQVPHPRFGPDAPVIQIR